MMKGRVILVAGALAATLGLAACSSPDPAPARSALASAHGIQGADVILSHPGAPWNTTALVTLYVADESVESVTAAARSAVAELARGPLADHPVTIFVVPGRPSDYSPDHPGIDSRLRDLNGVARKLALRPDSGGDALDLSPDDIRRLTGGL